MGEASRTGETCPGTFWTRQQQNLQLTCESVMRLRNGENHGCVGNRMFVLSLNKHIPLNPLGAVN